MSKEKELEALKVIDVELRYKIDLKRLSDNTLESLFDCYVSESRYVKDELLEAIAKESNFNPIEYRKYYRNVGKFHYIKGRKTTPLTDLQLNNFIKEYELKRRA
jgi:hypothetical protein